MHHKKSHFQVCKSLENLPVNEITLDKNVQKTVIVKTNMIHNIQACIGQKAVKISIS